MSARQLWLLALLTLIWGFNWPVMKVGVSAYPPLGFRAVSMWLGLPLLWLICRLLRVPLRIERRHWSELAMLTTTNMVIWYGLAIVSLQTLSSGRAAILGYTMPIFSAVWGALLFGQRLSLRQIGGVGAAALGVTLLLWHQLGTISGQPWGAVGMLVSAAVWGLGTQQLRHTRITAPSMALVFWMSLATTLVMTLLALLLEPGEIALPSETVWVALVYNAVLIIGIGQPIWLVLARSLPPIASTLSVMLIPVLGTVAGAWWLREQLHWQDAAAILLMLTAIASVLLPARHGRAASGAAAAVPDGSATPDRPA